MGRKFHQVTKADGTKYVRSNPKPRNEKTKIIVVVPPERKPPKKRKPTPSFWEPS
jgi:hypothetical protein